MLSGGLQVREVVVSGLKPGGRGLFVSVLAAVVEE